MSILGETLQVSGDDLKTPVSEEDRVLVNGSIAYVSQEVKWKKCSLRSASVSPDELFTQLCACVLLYVRHGFAMIPFAAT